MRKRSELAKFADRLVRKTNCIFFIEIIYNPGRHSRSIHLDEIFIAQPKLQKLRPDGRVENATFDFVDKCDMLDELGSAHAQGTTANSAHVNLLRAMAGKRFAVRIKNQTYRFRVPKTLTA